MTQEPFKIQNSAVVDRESKILCNNKREVVKYLATFNTKVSFLLLKNISVY